MTSALGLHGLLNVDKPLGITSRDVVDRVGRLVRRTKIGHAGTLDPLATGVLVVCLGAATRLVERIQEHSKGYRAGLKLGVRSDTDDCTGTVTPGGECSGISAGDVEAALSAFQGEIIQIPPRISAVHVAGQRAYDLARAEKPFVLAARPVRVDSICLTNFSASEGELEIVCGSGTYVRALIRDLGERLGCGAVMTSLRRTFIGPFREADAVPLNCITPETLASHVRPMRTVLCDEPCITASEAECRSLLQGRGIAAPEEFFGESDRPVAVLDPAGELFAFAAPDAERRLLLPLRVFVR